MLKNTNVKSVEHVVIRFSGDSGDGMQLAGNIFSNVSAGEGNQISTFPDYPAEIRAPQGSLSGVSGFQVNLGGPQDKSEISKTQRYHNLRQRHVPPRRPEESGV